MSPLRHPPHHPPHRRAPLVAAVALALGGLSGCGPFTGDHAAAPAAVSSPMPTHHAVEDRAFPVTVTHRYGDTELADPPARIVTLGVHDADTLVSLGLRPVGVRGWARPDLPYADLPWAPDDLPPDAPAVASPAGEIDFAAVAALAPDLITVINSDVSEADYLHLTEIAPTVAQVPDTGDLLSSWQEETRLLGLAVGRPSAAEGVIAELEASLAAVRDRYPVLTDADVALVTYDGRRSLRLVNPYDPRARGLAALGMRFPDRVAEATAEDEFDVPTDLDVLAGLEDDLDLVVWLPTPGTDPAAAAAAAEQMRADQDYADIDPVRNGASVFLADPEALSYASGPSLVHAAEANGAALAEALDEKARQDRSGVVPGPLPGYDPAFERERDAARTPRPEPAGSPTPSGSPVEDEATADPTGTPASRPAGTPSPGPHGGWFLPGLVGGDDGKPVQKRKPKRERGGSDQRGRTITG